MTNPVVGDTPMEVVSIVGMHLVPIDLLEREVLLGWGVSCQISLLPLSIWCLKLRVLPDPTICLVGVRVAGVGGRGVLRFVPFLSLPGRVCFHPLFDLPNIPCPIPFPLFSTGRSLF